MSHLSENENKLRQVVVKAILAELQTMGISSPKTKEIETLNANEQTFVSFIGYSGEKISGNFFLLCDENFLKATYPKNLTYNEVTANDWAGEIVNRLMGAFKRKLNDLDINVHMTIPGSMDVEQIQPLNSRFSKAYRLEIDSDEVKSYICVFNKILIELDLTRKKPVASLMPPGQLMEF